jgi:large subunit ribosomal protein L25
MEVMTVKAEPRTELGTRSARRIRESGKLPAIIYGHGVQPEAITLEQHELEVALARGARTLHVELGGETKQYLIKDVQYDQLNVAPIHLDLTRVDLHERVQVEVGIELRGTPKGVSEGGTLDQMMGEIEVECLVTDIPGTLHPLVADLHVGDVLLVKDLPLPPGVRALADPEERVAMVREAAAVPEEAEEEAVEEETSAQPEVIGRARKEEEEEGGS